jgi:hypothetical protein
MALKLKFIGPPWREGDLVYVRVLHDAGWDDKVYKSL